MNHKQDQPQPAADEMSLMDHLGELRRRLVISFAAVFLLSCLAYVFSNPIFDILTKPYFDSFGDNLLIGTGPAEAFLTKLKVSFFSGIVLASPVLFQQGWLFIAPGLHEHEKRLFWPFMISSCALFLLGIWFCYSAVFPIAFSFFRDQYESIGLTPTVRISEHLSTTITGLLCFGTMFEWPVVAFFLARLGIITDRTLIDGTRYAIVIIFVLSAILTPPDVISQFLMAGPLLVLYALSIVIVRYAYSPSSSEGNSVPAPSNPDRKDN